MIQRAFYSLEDTKTPFMFTIVQVGVNIVGSLLVGLYISDVWIVVALSLVTSGSIMVQSLLAFVLFKRKFGTLGHGQLTFATGKFAFAGAAAGSIGFAILQAMGGARPGAFPVLNVSAAVVTCVIVGSVVGVIYIALLKLFRVREVDTLLGPLLRLLQR
jgi:putative peptidoglycan lipid II flippase